MGSATREALAAARTALAGVPAKDGLTVAGELFGAGRVIGDSAQLRAALADPAASADEKKVLVATLFSSVSAPSRALLTTIVSSRWSTQDDLLAGIEETGIRAAARSAGSGVSVEDELFAFGSAVSSNAELELAVGSKLGTASAKAALVRSLLAKKASPQTLTIVEHLVQQPRGRRVGELLRGAAEIVADEAGQSIATVSTAVALSAQQLGRLAEALSAKHGRPLRINQIVDPTIIGGLRVQVGDDVIDGSVASRLSDLRIRLAS